MSPYAIITTPSLFASNTQEPRIPCIPSPHFGNIMMSSYEDDTYPSLSRQNSFQLRSETPDIIEQQNEFTSPTGGGGFNLADELAMAEDSDEDNAEGFLAPPKGRGGVNMASDYEGSEYGDIDDDSDGYLSEHVDVNEMQLLQLVEEVGAGRGENAVSLFVSDLRGMRGQMDVENRTRRLSLALRL